MNWPDWIKSLSGNSTTRDYKLVAAQPVRNYSSRTASYSREHRQIFVTARRIPKGFAAHAAQLMPRVRRSSVTIRREQPLWQARGWKQNGHTWKGMYQVGRQSWQGRAETIGDRFKFYIQNPPHALLTGAHGRCYIAKGDKGYFVHFTPTQPESLSAGIGGIEFQLAQVV